MRFNDTQKFTIMKDERQRIDKITEELRAKEMEATSISHLVGRMDAILEVLESSVLQIKMEYYQKELLVKQINEAKAVNDEIFEVHKKNELNRIKKTYSNESK